MTGPERPAAKRWLVYPYDHDALLHPTNQPVNLDQALVEARRLLEADALRVEIVAAPTQITELPGDTWEDVFGKRPA